MRTIPIPDLAQSQWWAVSAFEYALIDILHGQVSASTIHSVRKLAQVIDIDDFDFFLAIAGGDPDTTDFAELNKLALEELIRYLTEADNDC